MKGLKDKTTGRFVTNLLDKECLFCKNIFHPRFSVMKFCSKKCEGMKRRISYDRACVICGNIFYSKTRKTRFCSQPCYTKSCIRTKFGPENHSWKGLSSINKRIRGLKKYLFWIDSVLKRDNYTCIECGEITNLHVDHIIPLGLIIEKVKFNRGLEDLYENVVSENILWDIGNGRTLCRDCHRNTDTYGWNAINKLKK